MSATFSLAPLQPKREKPQAEWVRLTGDEFSELYIQEHYSELATEAPLLCTCLQRDFPHDLSVHDRLGRDTLFDSRLKFAWPWSLRLVELSTERKTA